MLLARLLSRPLVSALLLTLLLPVAAAGQTVGLGEPLREITMKGLSGEAQKLSEFRGRPLIINVWASWCGPCRAEMASLDRLARSPAGRQFTVIGISTDDRIEAARGYLRQNPSSFRHFIDSRLALENMLGADRLPLTVLVDARGRVLSRTYGAQEWDSAASVRSISRSFGLRP
jgi:thiol-disulfide isomerase/thioredoxin